MLRCDRTTGTGPLSDATSRHISHRAHTRAQPRAVHVRLPSHRPVPAHVCRPLPVCVQLRGPVSPCNKGPPSVRQRSMRGDRSSAHAPCLARSLGPCGAPGGRRWTYARPRARWAARRAGPARRRRSAAPPRAPQSAAACGPCAGRAPRLSPVRTHLYFDSYDVLAGTPQVPSVYVNGTLLARTSKRALKF